MLLLALSSLRRDLMVVARGLLGRNPPPLVARPPRPAPALRDVVADGARTLRVVERVLETPDAVSIVLEDPTGAPIEFQPGQFFTVLVDVGRKLHRRAYSASSDWRDPARVRLTIKRVAGGVVSNHLVDQLIVGATLRVLGPSGSFVCAPDPHAARHLVLIAGGSGITPLMSIATAVLAEEPGSVVSLIYGNRTISDVIFLHDLEQIAERLPERFRLALSLDAPPADWTGASGLLDRAALASVLDELHHPLPAEYFVCGPEPMMAAARAELEARGVAAERLHEERFSRPELRADRVRKPGPQRVAFSIGDGTREIDAGEGQTLLEAGLEAGVPLPFSCAMGGCGACRVKLTAGVVDMEEPSCLTAAERAQGYVLACVSRAETTVAVTVEER